jgi:hypothetical protein
MTAYPVRATAAEIFFQRHALDGSFGVQLERPPRHLHQALSLQLLDSDRVDVAPGSNVVGEDDQLDGLGCFSHLLNSTTLTLSTVAKGSEVDQWFAGNPAEPILQRVREVILKADPRMTEYLKYGTVQFAYDGDFANFVQHGKETVSVMFNRGARIPGTFPHLEGAGPSARFMRFADVKEVNQRAAELTKIVAAWCDRTARA